MEYFTTKQQAVDYLVNKGEDPAIAKAAINESFNYEQDGDTRDLLYTWQDGDYKPDTVKLTDMLLAFKTMKDMMSKGLHGIKVDGELLYDHSGKHLKY